MTKYPSETIQVGKDQLWFNHGVADPDSRKGTSTPAIPFSAVTVRELHKGNRQEGELACGFQVLLPWLDVFHPRPMSKSFPLYPQRTPQSGGMFKHMSLWGNSCHSKPSEHPFWNLWVLDSAKEPCFRVKLSGAESYVSGNAHTSGTHWKVLNSGEECLRNTR